MKKLRVTVEGKIYDVLVEILDEGSAAASAPIPATATAIGSADRAGGNPPAKAAPKPAAEAGDVVSPLAGKVVSIDVRVGQTVAEGAQVATVEAMKMNTYIYAPRAGSVAAVLVNPGDGVEEGSALMRLA